MSYKNTQSIFWEKFLASIPFTIRHSVLRAMSLICWLHFCLSIMIFHFLFPLLVVIESVTFSAMRLSFCQDYCRDYLFTPIGAWLNSAGPRWYTEFFRPEEGVDPNYPRPGRAKFPYLETE